MKHYFQFVTDETVREILELLLDRIEKLEARVEELQEKGGGDE